MGELTPEEIVDIEHNLRKKPIIGGVEGSVHEVTANVGFNCKRKEVAWNGMNVEQGGAVSRVTGVNSFIGFLIGMIHIE